MFLVVFRNRKRAGFDAVAYAAESQKMRVLASKQPGFIAFKSYTAEDGEDIAVSEWESEAAAHAWGRQADHALAQARGRAEYYDSYTLFLCDSPSVTEFRRT